jgi:hypothetical protein
MNIKKLLKQTSFLILLLIAAVSMAFTVSDGGGKKTAKESSIWRDAYLMNINNIQMPMNRTGVMANVVIGNYDHGALNGENFLFSGGFFLSGITNGFPWSNAVASASRIEDFVAGPVGRTNDPKARIYVVEQSLGDFSQDWEDWRDAVEMGADFYDGDGDGVYNPVDIDGNGKWDPYEDRPDLIGDITAWCVYNDGKDPALRRFNDVESQGIEVRQTVFAFANKGTIGHMIFIRYQLVNVGTVADVIDSVYFGVWADPDLGDYANDLVGADTTLNAGFVYDKGFDAQFGNNSPCFLIDFFQGPISYLPGVSFTDVNGNGIWDEGVDIALDTAQDVRGQQLGVDLYPGATNLGLSSFVHYMQSHPTQGDPNTRLEARNYLLGRNKFGQVIDPCTWTFGTVLGGVPCAQVNPLFMYSGDPVTETGWINNTPIDQRQMSNTGPFQLIKDQPINIVAAYIVGRGVSSLASINVAREYSRVAQVLFDRNFPSPPPPPPIDYNILTGSNFIELTIETAPNLNYRAVDSLQEVDRRVQGFFVEAYRTNSPVPFVDGIENERMIMHWNLADSIMNIWGRNATGGYQVYSPSAQTNAEISPTVYRNPETGRLRFRLTQDPFTGGPLVKGKEYYFRINQYTVNTWRLVNRNTGTFGPAGDYIDSTSNPIEEFVGPMRSGAGITQMITVIFGEDMYSPALAEQSGVRQPGGVASGEVKYVIVNNEALTGDTYRITFMPDRNPNEVTGVDPYRPFWTLTNVTTGQVLADSMRTFDFNLNDISGRVYQGFIPKIEPVTPAVGNASNQYRTQDTARWFGNFNDPRGKGIYYMGKDVPDAGAGVERGSRFHPLYPATRSRVTTADRLRRVELRFGTPTSGKAYRYVRGIKGAAIPSLSNYAYAGFITAADTGGVKGSIGKLGEGFVDVPFTAWVVDTVYKEEYQLAVGFIERRAPTLLGTPDGVWDPGDSLGRSEEVILIFDSPYDPNGQQVQYTGTGATNNEWADVIKGFVLQDPSASDSIKAIAASPLFNTLYMVGLERFRGSFYTPGDTLIIPVFDYPYTSKDVYEFNTLRRGELTDNQRRELFNRVNVFPNPLFAYNPATSYSGGNPDEPFVTFSNLPTDITIKVYSLSGILVRTLTTDDKASPTSPFLRWNLQNENGLRVASGMYMAIVTSPLYGEKILKFAVIMPQKQIQFY